jgi:hypothetical protein
MGKFVTGFVATTILNLLAMYLYNPPMFHLWIRWLQLPFLG